jgi:NAD(P)-dependent dehydrogenase (short-subunit alcohol dehydrogenase family)
MKVDLRNRIALVTGAAGDIGRCAALALAENGATVAVTDLHVPPRLCEELCQRGGKAHAYHADISDGAAVNAMIAQVESDLGPVEILVNSAGLAPGDRFLVHQFPDSEWQRILRVDLDGVFYCSRAVSERMVQRRKGTIINIASAFGIVPARLQCAHAAANAGVLHFTRAHALEVGQYSIRVNGVSPGLFVRESSEDNFYSPENKQSADNWLSHIPLGIPGRAEDVVGAVLYLASDAAKNVTGQVLAIDGGWTAGFSRDW